MRLQEQSCLLEQMIERERERARERARQRQRDKLSESNGMVSIAFRRPRDAHLLPS